MQILQRPLTSREILDPKPVIGSFLNEGSPSPTHLTRSTLLMMIFSRGYVPLAVL